MLMFFFLYLIDLLHSVIFIVYLSHDFFVFVFCCCCFNSLFLLLSMKKNLICRLHDKHVGVAYQCLQMLKNPNLRQRRKRREKTRKVECKPFSHPLLLLLLHSSCVAMVFCCSITHFDGLRAGMGDFQPYNEQCLQFMVVSLGLGRDGGRSSVQQTVFCS